MPVIEKVELEQEKELAEYYEIDFNDVHEKSVWREG